MSWDMYNQDVDPNMIYFNVYSSTLSQPIITTTVTGGTVAPVTTITGNSGTAVTGPAITISGGSTGYTFTGAAGTVTLAVSNAATVRTSISAAKSGVNTDITELNGASQVDVSARYEVAGIQVVQAQGAAVADATGAGDVVAQLNTLLARLRAHGLIAT